MNIKEKKINLNRMSINTKATFRDNFYPDQTTKNSKIKSETSISYAITVLNTKSKNTIILNIWLIFTLYF